METYAVEVKVPTIVCEGCADTIRKAIVGIDEAAIVDVDVAAKQVKVNSRKPLEEIKGAIAATGHTIT